MAQECGVHHQYSLGAVFGAEPQSQVLYFVGLWHGPPSLRLRCTQFPCCKCLPHLLPHKYNSRKGRTLQLKAHARPWHEAAGPPELLIAKLAGPHVQHRLHGQQQHPLDAETVQERVQGLQRDRQQLATMYGLLVALGIVAVLVTCTMTGICLKAGWAARALFY